MSDESNVPNARDAETSRKKSERLKAARLQAERDRELRIDRTVRKASARRKVLEGN